MKMLHVTIQTNKFEEEIKFYREVVGLGIARDMRGGPMNMIFLADEDGGTEVEIIENAKADDAGNRNLSVGFKAEDPAAKREELAAAGYEVSPMIEPAPGVAFFFVKDPAGVSVQFM